MGKKYETKIMTVGMDAIEQAAQVLKDNKVVAIPTETVYGLAAKATNKAAVKRIFAAKNRPADNPLIVHVCDMIMVEALADEVPDSAKILAEKFWPGPLTMVMKKSHRVPEIVTGGLDTVAIRMPSHPIAYSIIEYTRLPLAAPSANISGKPSPTNARDVLEDMDGRIPLIIDGGECQVGVESTVLDLTSEKPTILRPGAITKDMISEALGGEEIIQSKNENFEDEDAPKAPGMKYKHYAPNANITIVKGIDIAVSRYINRAITEDNKNGIKSVALCYKENSSNFHSDTIILGSVFYPETIAENLFATLRKLDSEGYEKAYVQYLEGDNIEIAIMNRLLKAAGNNVVEADKASFLV